MSPPYGVSMVHSSKQLMYEPDLPPMMMRKAHNFKAILHPYICCQIPYDLADFLISEFLWGSILLFFITITIVPMVISSLKKHQTKTFVQT